VSTSHVVSDERQKAAIPDSKRMLPQEGEAPGRVLSESR
jgi:hypothetical protein